MTDIELKPCPFCGHIPVIYGVEIKDFVNGAWAATGRKEYWVQPRCEIPCLYGNTHAKAFGIVGGIHYTSIDAAVTAWNRRTIDNG